MSIHTFKSRQVAAARGGYAGAPDVADLWGWSKRELVEIVLRLASLNAGSDDADEALKSGAAATRAREERDTLIANGIL